LIEPVWLVGSLDDEVSDWKWSEDWSKSVDLSAGLQIVSSYQTRTRTVLEVILISVFVGVMGNVLAQALVPLPTPSWVGALAFVSIFVVVCAFLYREYAPSIPAQIWAQIDHQSLLQSYGSGKSHVRYLMTGAGVSQFEKFAKAVLEDTLGGVKSAPLGCQISNEKWTIPGKSFPEVILSADLKTTKEQGMEGIKASIEIRMYAGSRETPTQVDRVNLMIGFKITSPKHPLADKFVLTVLRPFLRITALFYSAAFWSHLPLSEICSLREYIETVDQYRRDHGQSNRPYLMYYYPYDGLSRTVLVLDASLVKEELERRAKNPEYEDVILTVLRETRFLGCYVTDCEDWAPAEAYQQGGDLFRMRPHLEKELTVLDPETVVTVGQRAMQYANNYLRRLGISPRVINTLDDVVAPVGPAAVEHRLKEELSKKPP